MKGLEVFVLYVVCMCIWFWDVSLFSPGCSRSWSVLEFVSLFCVGPCFYMKCLVFCVHCSFCAFVFQCLVMSSLVGTWSLIGHHDRIYILSFQIRCHLWCSWSVYLVSVVFLVLLVLCGSGKINCMCDYYNRDFELHPSMCMVSILACSCAWHSHR